MAFDPSQLVYSIEQAVNNFIQSARTGRELQQAQERLELEKERVDLARKGFELNRKVTDFNLLNSQEQAEQRRTLFEQQQEQYPEDVAWERETRERTREEREEARQKFAMSVEEFNENKSIRRLQSITDIEAQAQVEANLYGRPVNPNDVAERAGMDIEFEDIPTDATIIDMPVPQADYAQYARSVKDVEKETAQQEEAEGEPEPKPKPTTVEPPDDPRVMDIYKKYFTSEGLEAYGVSSVEEQKERMVSKNLFGTNSKKAYDYAKRLEEQALIERDVPEERPSEPKPQYPTARGGQPYQMRAITLKKPPMIYPDTTAEGARPMTEIEAWHLADQLQFVDPQVIMDMSKLLSAKDVYTQARMLNEAGLDIYKSLSVEEKEKEPANIKEEIDKALTSARQLAQAELGTIPQTERYSSQLLEDYTARYRVAFNKYLSIAQADYLVGPSNLTEGERFLIMYRLDGRTHAFHNLFALASKWDGMADEAANVSIEAFMRATDIRDREFVETAVEKRLTMGIDFSDDDQWDTMQRFRYEYYVGGGE